MKQDEGTGRRSPQVQGPRVSGRLEVERRQEPPFAEPKEFPRRGDGQEKTVAAAADAE